MTNLSSLTLKKALDAIAAKETTAAEITTAVQESIAQKNDQYNVYTSVNEDPAAEIAAGANSPLAGLPIAVKDNFCTTKLPTTASTNVLREFQSPFESTVTTRLKAAGGVIIGKTNMDAWAHGSSTETSDFGTTRNPRNPDHSPGGSSGGSAAAIAADMCIAALGSETAGSIRLPAAWCGIVGLKPTYGRVSRYGVVAMASSTDSPGPLTKTVEDSAILLNHIAGHDPYDGTSSTQAKPDFTATLGKSIKGMKIGVIYFEYPELQAVKAIYEKELKVLEDLGASVEFVQAMDPKYAISVYTVVQRGEVSSNLARYDGIRYGRDRAAFGDEAKKRIMLGTYTLSKGYADQYYNLAQKVRSLFMEDFAKHFATYDVLIAPTTPSYAEKVGASAGQSMFGELMDALVEASSITGLPGISVPCYHDPASNLFLGMDIMAPMWREDLCIQVASAYENATTWNTWRSA